MKRTKKVDPNLSNPTFTPWGGGSGKNIGTLITGRPGLGFPGAAARLASSQMLITGRSRKGKLNPLKIAS